MEHILNKPFVDRSIILAKRDFGEGHIMVTCLTEHRGLIKAFAFGGKRISKRFKGSLEYFKVMDLEFTPKNSSNNDISYSINAVKEVKNTYDKISRDMNKFIPACYILELSSLLMNHMEPSGKSGSGFFKSVTERLEYMNCEQTQSPEAMIKGCYEFCLFLMHETGFIPDLDQISSPKEQLYRMEQLHSSILEHSPRSFCMLYEMLNNSCQVKGSPVRNR